MHFLNSVILAISSDNCDLWPLLFLGLGILMWLLGWLFGRSKLSNLRSELEEQQKNTKRLNSENENFKNDIKIIQSDNDRTNKSLIIAKNELESHKTKLSSATSRSKSLEREKSELLSEKNRLASQKGSLTSEISKLKENSLQAADANISNNAIADLQGKLADSERSLADVQRKLKDSERALNDQRKKLTDSEKAFNDQKEKLANLEKTLTDRQEKLTNSEKALAACEESKTNETRQDKVSFVAPPPPIIPPVDDIVETNEINQLISESKNVRVSGLSATPIKTPDTTPIENPDATPITSTDAPSGSSKTGMGSYFKNDNLQIMEGVGPKIESILQDAGYRTWSDMANASDTDLQKVLDNAGPRYRMHNPTAWSDQARFASNGEWDKLIHYQKDIDGNSTEPRSKAEKLYFKGLGFSAAKPEDLKVVEGIGPKIESLLKNAGVQNWTDLARSEAGRLQDILTSAGDRYRLADPTTWPKQAELAAANKWTELKEYQDFLSGGKA